MAIFVLGAIAFVILMVLGALIVEQRRTSSRKNISMKLLRLNREGNKTVLKGLLSDLTGGKLANTFNYDGTHMTDMILVRLIEQFGEDNVSMLQQDCTIPEQKGGVVNCNSIYGIKTKTGEAVISLSGRDAEVLDKYKKPHYRVISDGKYALEDFTTDNKIKISWSINVASTDDVNSELMQTIQGIMSECEVEVIPYEDPEYSRRMQFFSFEKERGGGYSLKRQAREMKEIPTGLLNLSYNEVKLNYEGEELSVPMGEAMPLFSNILEAKENIAIFGPAGGGKSRLADEIALRLSKRGNVGIIFVSPSMINEFQKVELLPELIAQVDRIKEEYGITPVFVIDEAETLLAKTDDGIHSVVNSFMLSLMDGQVQKLLNCACILTFNCPIELLNDKAFRPGRMGLIVKLDHLSIEKSKGLVEQLKEYNPNLVFDVKAWEKTQRQSQVSLAEVYALFSHPSKQRVIAGIIRKMKGETEPPATPTRPVPTSPTRPTSPERAHMVTDLQPLPQSSQPSQQNNRHQHGKGKNRNRGSRPA